jgi:ATP-grasp domain
MNRYAILSNGYASPLLQSVCDIATVLQLESVVKSNIQFTEHDLLYVPSEDGLSAVAQRTKNVYIKDAIALFKDKCSFRQKIAVLFPEFYYTVCRVDEVSALKLDLADGRRYVIKPQRGYYATAVKTVDAGSNLVTVQAEIAAELAAREKYFPGNMLSKDTVIVEEFIGTDIRNSMSLQGAELAVDLFYDSEGTPVIVGLYHHPHPSNDCYFHTLYYTNAEIFESFAGRVLEFFWQLQSLGMKLRSFPLHAEFKLRDGKLIPIEVNPYRFGGYGLADLMHYVGGVNPYRIFFDDAKPDWKTIWAGKSDNYGCIVGYNGRSVDVRKDVPDHTRFKHFLSSGKHFLSSGLLKYYTLDHTAAPLFGIAYVRTSDEELFRSVITVEFDEFFNFDAAVA